MKKQQHNIDEIFREALGGHREVPPPAAWTDIERRLDEQDRRRRAIALFRWPWMLGLLLTVSAGTWLAAGQFNNRRVPAAGPSAEAGVHHNNPSSKSARRAQTLPVQNGSAASLASVVATSSATAGITTAANELAAEAAGISPAAASEAAAASVMAGTAYPIENSPLPAAPGLLSATLLRPAATFRQSPREVVSPRTAETPLAALYEPSNDLLPQAAPAPLAADNFRELLPASPLRFTFGADLGYEYALNGNAPGRYAAGLSLSWEFRPGLSIGINPTYRFGNVAVHELSPASTTTQINTEHDSYTVSTYDTLTGAVTHYVHTSESYDSAVTTAATTGGGRFYEVSLPLMLSYQSRGGWSVGMGPTLNFGGNIRGGTGGTSTVYHVQNEDSMMIVKSFMQPAVYSSNSFATNNAQVPKPAVGPGASPESVRLGYMLNIGYRWRQFMLNASLSQQLSGYSNVDRSFQGIFSNPYLRLSLGYRLPFNLRRPSLW